MSFPPPLPPPLPAAARPQPVQKSSNRNGCLIALAICLESPGAPIFAHWRVGRSGRSFPCLKFRTMVRNSAEMLETLLCDDPNAKQEWESDFKLRCDPRITRIGKLLRKTHLDELPQIINVLRGEMSFVGPRSERVELVRVFQREVPFYRARMLVKPGITGWAQIHQAYAETIEETATKLQYDLYYIEHASILMDLNILLRTVGSVLGFKGR